MGGEKCANSGRIVALLFGCAGTVVVSVGGGVCRSAGGAVVVHARAVGASCATKIAVVGVLLGCYGSPGSGGGGVSQELCGT